MPGIPIPTLTPEELDDLIFSSRTANFADLKSAIQALSTTYSCPPASVISSAIDVDAEGLGSVCSLLHYPSANGNTHVLKFLLESLAGPQSNNHSLVNHQNASGNTPLHWAAINGHLECVKLLIAAGADPSITNGAGHDAVFEAEMGGKDGNNEVAEWILKECAGLEKGAGGQTVESEESPPTSKEIGGADNSTSVTEHG
ncbi:MAG: hypothetical protein Q9227_008342 [Pyrenula ochraceoflavens]